ncbi:hypothetical protein HMPREF9163_01115 [Selenomonas sp. oral taxon 138 str. F0429]|nr:hypothetical protein HMPREF9163_01115 [Selenomonas sp. oral taxon 138 str. F0429]
MYLFHISLRVLLYPRSFFLSIVIIKYFVHKSKKNWCTKSFRLV